jgi:hypothetical protein
MVMVEDLDEREKAGKAEVSADLLPDVRSAKRLTNQRNGY